MAPPTFLSLPLPHPLTFPLPVVSVLLSQTDLPQSLLILHLQRAPFPHLWIRAAALKKWVSPWFPASFPSQA